MRGMERAKRGSDLVPVIQDGDAESENQGADQDDEQAKENGGLHHAAWRVICQACGADRLGLQQEEYRKRGNGQLFFHLEHRKKVGCAIDADLLFVIHFDPVGVGVEHNHSNGAAAELHILQQVAQVIDTYRVIQYNDLRLVFFNGF